MARQKYYIGAFLALVILQGGIWLNSSKKEVVYSLTGKTMGTNYSVKIVAPTGRQPLSKDSLKKQIDQELLKINSLMSTWDKASELSRFNANGSKEPAKVSLETFRVIKESQRIARLSDGAFDITLGPVINAWGFGPNKKEGKIPTEEEIQNLTQFVGFDKIKLIDPDYLIKFHPSVYIDLSAIAKGYGVDRISEFLESYNLHRYLVEIGGEIRVKGQSPKGHPWKVGIEKPEAGLHSVVEKIVSLRDMAMATSGSYRNYFEKEGKRFSHTIDPTTMAPIKHNLVSVSVFHPQAMTADALATTLMVMGDEKGLEFARKNKIMAYFIVKNLEGFVKKTTVSFPEDGRLELE